MFSFLTIRPASLGLTAAALMTVGITLLVAPLGLEGGLPLAAVAIRVGILLALFWLAWPDLAGIPWWLVGGGLLAAVIIVARGDWTALLLAGPAVLAFWLLLPRLWGKPKP